MAEATNQLVRCSQCRTPIARLTPEALVIESRHHGERHVTVVSLASLLDKSREMVKQ